MTYYITNYNKHTDGFGQKYRDIILSYCYCKSNKTKKKEYIYSPFLKTDHNETNDKNYDNNFDIFCGFINYPKKRKDYNHIIEITFRKYTNDLHTSFIQPCVNVNKVINNENIKFIRKLYYSTPKKHINFVKNKTNIAVHIRWGDTSLQFITKKYNLTPKNI